MIFDSSRGILTRPRSTAQQGDLDLVVFDGTGTSANRMWACATRRECQMVARSPQRRTRKLAAMLSPSSSGRRRFNSLVTSRPAAGHQTHQTVLLRSDEVETITAGLVNNASRPPPTLSQIPMRWPPHEPSPQRNWSAKPSGGRSPAQMAPTNARRELWSVARDCANWQKSPGAIVAGKGCQWKRMRPLALARAHPPAGVASSTAADACTSRPTYRRTGRSPDHTYRGRRGRQPAKRPWSGPGDDPLARPPRPRRMVLS